MVAATARRSAFIDVAGTEMHVSEWGDPANPPLVMWHGLARTGRDFDEAAAALSDTYFVLCPDTIGRGLSGWAADRERGYGFAAYGDAALAMLDHYGAAEIRWVGTSMGGLIGVTLAAGRLMGRIVRLVVNDIGPEVAPDGLGRIVDYVGHPPVFETIREIEAWLRTVYAPFGPNSEGFWRRLTLSSARRTDAGKITVHYDPRIVTQFTSHPADLDLWPVWDRVEAPTLLLRGEHSDVLSEATAEAMTRRGPRPRLEVVAGVGHAPTLATSGEIRLLRRFLA